MTKEVLHDPKDTYLIGVIDTDHKQKIRHLVKDKNDTKREKSEKKTKEEKMIKNSI
jgi:hypothetical protein